MAAEAGYSASNNRRWMVGSTFVPEDIMTKPIRCRLGWHKWTNQYTDERVRYVVCQRCRKKADPPDFVGPLS